MSRPMWSGSMTMILAPERLSAGFGAMLTASRSWTSQNLMTDPTMLMGFCVDNVRNLLTMLEKVTRQNRGSVNGDSKSLPTARAEDWRP